MTAEQQSTPDVESSDTTSAWMASDRTHLERLIADTADTAPKRHRWWSKPLPWLVVRQYHDREHITCQHRWEWVAEGCAIRRENRHRREWGVFYTARHRTQIRKATSIEADA